MNPWIFTALFSLVFVGAPLLLASSQDVPARSIYQTVVLLTSLAAFGLTLGVFWLTQLTARNVVKAKLSKMMAWHKTIGYVVCLALMVHPILMIARRFWVVESNPIENFKLMLGSPLLWPGIAAWILLMVILVSAFFRHYFTASTFRKLHGWLAICFVGLAAWHVIAMGRHSDLILSMTWGLLAAVAVTGYFNRIFKKSQTS